MKLIKSKDDLCWHKASKILLEVIDWLKEKDAELWSKGQVSVSSLKESYALDELYFIEQGSELIGLAFLQRSDKLFWPEINDDQTLFVHKLCLKTNYKSKGNGKKAISLIIKQAKHLGLHYVRLDCDVRKPLINFYKNCGFCFVDYKYILGLKVARLEYACSEYLRS